MTALLLASQERLLELFRSLEAEGILQLQIASSIADAEEVLSEAEARPEFTFIQSRISALSGEILVRHFRSMVANGSTIVLLSADEDEIGKARAQGASAINIGKSDEKVASAVRDLIHTATTHKEDIAAVLAAAAADSGLPPTAEAELGTPVPPPPAPPVEGHAAPAQVAAAPEATAVPSPEAAPEPPPIPGSAPAHPEAAVEEPVVPHAAPPASFHDALFRTMQAQQVASPEEPPPSVEPPPLVEPPSSVEAEPVAPQKRHSRVAPPETRRDFAHNHFLSHRRLRRRSVVLAAVIVVVVAAASAVLLREGSVLVRLLGLRGTSPLSQQTAPAPKTSLPARHYPAAPAAKAGAPAAAPPTAKSAKGLRDLPPFIVDAEEDAAYARTHPGWERYLTAAAEFKIFREGSLIKAVQVMAAKDQIISADLFNWSKKELEGTGAARMQSKEQKENYQVEKWETPGAGLTLYRKMPDLKMRALVLYFR